MIIKEQNGGHRKVKFAAADCVLPLSPWKLHFTVNLPLFLL